MLFQDSELRKWMEKKEQDAFFAEAYDKLRGQAEKMDITWFVRRRQEMEDFRKRAENEGGGKVMRYGNEMRTTVQQLMALAVFDTLAGWGRMEVIRGLLEIILGESWRFQGRFEGWESDLWTADIGVGTAVAWELVKGKLSAEENSRIRETLYREGFLPLYKEWVDPLNRIHALDTMGHNWWSVCVSGAGVMLLVLGKAWFGETYGQLLGQVTASLEEWFFYDGNVGLNKHPNFGKQGDYREYMGYLVFGMAHFCIFMTLLEQIGEGSRLNVDEILEKIPDFFLENLLWTEDGLRCADFGDNHLGTTSMQFLYFLCRRFARDDMLEAVNGMYRPESVCELLFYPAVLERKEHSIAALAVYQNSGHAMLRSGTEREDMAFIMKCGEGWNHNHLDAGTFELSVNGEKVITDSGTCSYSNPLYASYYVQPCAHNTITFDGKGCWEGAQYEGTKYPGRYAAWMEKEKYRYLLADCTGPYSYLLQRFYRHVILAGDKLILVDDIEACRDGQVEMFFHGNGALHVEGNLAKIRTEKQEFQICFPYAGRDDLTVRHGYGHSKGEDEKGREIIERQDYVACICNTLNRRAKCVTVFLPQRNLEKTCGTAEFPEVTAYRNPDVMEFRITDGTGTESYLVNCRADGSVMHKNGWIAYQGVETDAFLCGLHYDTKGRLRAYSIHNGSKLKIAGKLLFSSNRKQNHYETFSVH